MEACRNWQKTMQLECGQKALSSWELSIHQRDQDNNPAYSDLPPVHGLALGPNDLKGQGASGKQGVWSQHPINAVPSHEASRVDALIKDIIQAWEMMPQ